jgi:hypothetical protein
VSEKLTLVESGLRGLAETSGETSVDKLQSLEEFKVSSLIDRGNPLPSSDIRTAASVSIQQPTVAQIQTAPSSEVAGQKGLTDGGFVNVSKQAIICSSNAAIHVLRTTAPNTIAVVVPETEKLNPASYSDIIIREPGRPECRVPVAFPTISTALRIVTLFPRRWCQGQTSAAPTPSNCLTLSRTKRSVAKLLLPTSTVLISRLLSCACRATN